LARADVRAITYVPLFLQAVVGVKQHELRALMLPMMAGLVGGATGGGFLLSYTTTLPDPGSGGASPR